MSVHLFVCLFVCFIEETTYLTGAPGKLKITADQCKLQKPSIKIEIPYHALLVLSFIFSSCNSSDSSKE